MKAPVDYPLNASSLLKNVHGDELGHLCLLDRIEESAASTNPEQELTSQHTRSPLLSTAARPFIVDAPMPGASGVPTFKSTQEKVEQNTLHSITQQLIARHASNAARPS